MRHPTLTRFIHRPHWIGTRLLFGFAGFILAVLATGQYRLSREVAVRFIVDDDFSLGLRRVAYYLRRRFPGVRALARDGGFDPTLALVEQELTALEAFASRAGPSPSQNVFADRALIAARRLAQAKGSEDREAAQEAFVAATDQLLALGPAPKEVDEAWTALLNAPPVQNRPGDVPARMNVDAARSALEDFARQLPSVQWRWFVMSGTFLGLIREKGFLLHDYDIDLGIFAADTDVPELLARLGRLQGFVMRRVDAAAGWGDAGQTPARPALVKLLHRNGLKIDLFFHYDQEGGSVWHGSSLHQWINSDFALKPYDLSGVEVLGPEDADRYLTENYGDWRTPVRDFNCTVDTGNGSLMHHPSAAVHFIRKAVTQFDSENPSNLKLWKMLVRQGVLRPYAGKESRFKTQPKLFALLDKY